MDFFDSLEAASRPHVPRKPWMDECTMTLVTEETLPAVVDECIAAGEYALDLETTGLDNRVIGGRTVDRIVGACLSPDGVKGYYVPVLHVNHPDRCVSTTVFHREMTRLTSSNAVAVFHNAKFDQEFLQFNGWGGPLGEWDKPAGWDDTLILAYLRNTRERNKGLKHLSKSELNIEMIELDELFTAEESAQHGKNFSILDPEWGPTLWYACSDAICTYRLKRKLYPDAIDARDGLPTQMPLYRIEKLCVAATRWMERLRIPVDRDKVAELIRLGQAEWFPALRDVYVEASKALGRDITPGYFRILETDPTLRFDTSVVTPGILERVDDARAAADLRRMDPTEIDGKGGTRTRTIRKRVPGIVDKKVAEDIDFPVVYDVLKPEELGLLLRELGVGGLKTTEKSGQVKTSADELDRVVEEAGEDFPFIGKVKRFREVAKAIASNLMPLYEYTDPSRSPDGRIRVNFEAFKVDTGRFSTPGREGRAGFTGTIPWNLQSIPAGYDPRRPECSTRLRECIRAPKGRLLFAIDYSGEELRVVTNLSGEPLWVREFFRCSGCNHEFDRGATIPPPPDPPPPFCPTCGSDKIGDLHTLTALAVYGDGIKADKEMFKQRRKEAKGVNFALCYGGGGAAVQWATGCSKEEAWRIKRQFDGTYKTLFAWWKTQHDLARRTKHVLTAFNRRYPLPDIDSGDGGFRAKAERNAVNGPVQGCLHPDARVVTRTGLRTVRDLWNEANGGGPVRFDVWTGRGWSEARPLLSGSKPHVTTVFGDGGRIDTSPEHLFRTWRDGEFQWVRQFDLREGDWVARDAHAVDFPEPRYIFEDTGASHNSSGFTFDGNSEVLWELLGRVVGDGSIRDDGFTVHVGEAPRVLDLEVAACGYSAEAHARAFARRVSDGLGVRVVVKEKKRQVGDPRRNTWTVSVHNTSFVRFCRTVLGLALATTLDKTFPSAVWRESIRNRAAFLRGYFDADGTVSHRSDAVSVRSANVGLLRDTYALLRSVGVRAALREASQRVSVLDRAAFRDRVGFTVEYKSARVSRVSENPQTHRNTHLPTDIVSAVGNLIHRSQGYGALPRDKKSAVLRLRAGAGSKVQCGTLAEACGVTLPDEFAYDYTQVVGRIDHGTHVDMYDVEVLDDDHAFACDGVIVHNTGADIMKFAMGLVYLECKRRGWLDRVRMIITIHDELVFEIDEDVVAEALPVIKHTMLRRVIEKMPWRIPLTCDIEAGYDWTVPWNITEMEYGKDEVAPEIAHVVAALVSARGAAMPAPKAPEPDPVPVPATETPPTAHAAPTVPTTPAAIPQVSAGEVYVHTLRAAMLSMKLANRVSRVIAECAGRGVNPLRIVDDAGNILWYDPNVRVNPVEFAVLINRRGDS